MSEPRPYVSAAEYAERHGTTPSTVQRWHVEKRLPGAYKSPDTPRGTLFIPTDCPRPALTPGPVPKARR